MRTSQIAGSGATGGGGEEVQVEDGQRVASSLLFGINGLKFGTVNFLVKESGSK